MFCFSQGQGKHLEYHGHTIWIIFTMFRVASGEDLQLQQEACLQN